MQRQLLCCVLLLCSLVNKAQVPVLTIADKQTSDVTLQTLAIDVQVTGNIATTTMKMIFANKTDKILEGQLTFPMPEGVSVSRYALDINGKMREAVPVEKAKATQVFEAIERKRVDPGLLEKVAGNNFRTRIYPLPAHGTRTIIIGYEEELPLDKSQALRYHLPLGYEQTIGNFLLKATVYQSTTRPQLQEQPDGSFSFSASGNNYTAEMSRQHFTPSKPLTIQLPKPNDLPEVLMQPAGDQYYFVVNSFPKAQSRKKNWSDHIGIIWDVSLSGLQRDINKELELLGAIIQQKQNLTIELGLLGNRFMKNGTYQIKNGNWQELQNTLKNIVYDGGTNLSAINLSWLNAAEYLLFSDGLSTFGENHFDAVKPVHSISSAAKADYSTLKWLSARSGGRFINLSTTKAVDAAKMMQEEPLQFLGIKPQENIAETYPSLATPVAGSISVAGIAAGDDQKITLLFGYGTTVLQEKEVVLDAAKYGGTQVNVSRVWAQKKIAEMDLQYEENKPLISSLGEQFGIVTRNTSLIVLETLDDYMTYRITPPEELRSEYDNLMKQRTAMQQQTERQLMNEAVSALSGLTTWWNTKFDVEKKYPQPVKKTEQVLYTPPVVVADQELRQSAPSDRQSARNFRSSGNASRPAPQYGRRDEAGKAAADAVSADKFELSADARGGQGLAGSFFYTSNHIALDSSVRASGTRSQSASVVHIKTAPIRNDKAYIKQLTGTPGTAYQQYLTLRKKYINTPAFYFDVANWFYEHHDSTTALMILSNVAELDMENAPLLKLLAYKLKQAGEYDAALFACSKVRQWRPMEPQSYRDLGLALADKGMYQLALDTLYSALTQNYAQNIAATNSGIEEIIVTEINHLIATHKNELDLSRIDPALIAAMPVDVRVVLNWNMNDTDIDLWVTDPNNERCYYSNNQTAIGGHLSHDFTAGYGPEQFLLKKALKGRYKIEVNYYGDRQINEAVSTAVMAEIFTRYGNGSEQRKIVTLQMPKTQKEGVLVGTFNF